MDYSKIKTKIDLDSITTQEVFDRTNFEAIKFQAYNFIDSLNWDEALNFSNKLEKKISKISAAGSGQDMNFYNVLVFWILRLRLFAFNNMTPQDRLDLLHKNCATMALLGLNINMYITKALDFYGSIRPLQKDAESMVNAIKTSTEVFGSNIRGFQDLGFKPTLANWIKEYLSVLTVEGSVNRVAPSSFHIVKFLDSNAYVKLLTKNEKDALREILDLLNLLMEPISYVRVETTKKILGTIKSENDQSANTQKDKIEKEPAKVLSQPVVQPTIQPKTVESVKKEVKPIPKPVLEKKVLAQEPKPILTVPPKPEVKPVTPVQPIEIEIEVPPGISFGPPQKVETQPVETKNSSIGDIKSEIEAKKKQVESEIDKKIEILKKKTQK